MGKYGILIKTIGAIDYTFGNIKKCRTVNKSAALKNHFKSTHIRGKIKRLYKIFQGAKNLQTI